MFNYQYVRNLKTEFYFAVSDNIDLSDVSDILVFTDLNEFAMHLNALDPETALDPIEDDITEEEIAQSYHDTCIFVKFFDTCYHVKHETKYGQKSVINVDDVYLLAEKTINEIIHNIQL
ncbi:MAG: hypothetical protein ACRDCE_07875 [Cetobacterium sp.]|uniref:hypothetical protein n=1 Tax=Cetobacterium sp. TaxID=2071632 RepID=UPI003EE6C1D3